MAIATQIAGNDFTRVTIEEGTSELVKLWALELACPADVPLTRLKQHLLCLQNLMVIDAKPGEASFNPSGYWPSVSRELHALRLECEALRPHLERCKPWVKIVISKLMHRIQLGFRVYQIDEVEGACIWRPYPLHEESCRIFERLCFALSDLPKIELWRPLDASKRNTSSDHLDELTARTVAKVFDEYRDDSDQLTWGTIGVLQESCEQLLELRRDYGDFLSWSPSQILEVRLLADRLGCDEPAIPFEQEDTHAAFVRSIAQPGSRVWPIETDHQVRSWLKRILAWCQTRSIRLETPSQIAELESQKGVVNESATVDAVEYTNACLASSSDTPPAMANTQPSAALPAQDLELLPAQFLEHEGCVPVQQDTSGAPRKRRPKLAWDVANERAMAQLRKDPKFAHASLRKWAKQIGCATGSVSYLPLWRKVQKKKAAAQSERSVTTMSMSPEVLETICNGSDEAIDNLSREQDSDIKNDTRMARQYQRSRGT